MPPLPQPEPFTTSDLTYLTDLHAPVEVIAQRCARTPTLIEAVYEVNARRDATRRTPIDTRKVIARKGW